MHVCCVCMCARVPEVPRLRPANHWRARTWAVLADSDLKNPCSWVSLSETVACLLGLTGHGGPCLCGFLPWVDTVEVKALASWSKSALSCGPGLSGV